MIIVAGGDSFIWGSELADSPHGGPEGHSHSTFPALLATNYVCAAYPGIGNNEIANRVRTYLNWMKNDVFVIVCWTWPTRDNQTDSDSVIQNLQDYLEYHGYRYMFTCSDNCIVTGKLDYSNWYFFPPAEEKWNTTSPRGFYQWAVENKYNCGPNQHPLEDAHQDAAKLMQGKFNELVTKSLQSNPIGNTVS
jgi:hypothetical protein